MFRFSTLSILECQNYQSLSGADRKITYGNQNTVCDRGIHGWYRSEGAAGTRIPSSCPPKHQIVHIPQWLMVRSPGQFASTGNQTAATGQVPSK